MTVTADPGIQEAERPLAGTHASPVQVRDSPGGGGGGGGVCWRESQYLGKGLLLGDSPGGGDLRSSTCHEELDP
jgi:hypothetical protein